MKRFLLLPLLALAALAAEAPAPAITAEEIASPAGAGASGASIATGPDGTSWLSWIEPTPRAPGTTALRFARLDLATKRWSQARTIATGANWFINSADFPTLTVGTDGHVTAVWFANNPASAATAHAHHGAGYHALVSQSADGGATWGTPAPLTRESTSVEFVALAALADGRVLAAWLDGRGVKAGGKTQRLYARIVGASGPDTLVDPSVCDCCQTTLTAFPDGTALLAYRGRSEEEQRDIRVTRFRGGRWDEPRGLNNDDWRIAGCPVNGPQLASDGGRVAAAWFTAADNDPRVLASYSPDAGTRFLMPLRLDDGKAAGRVDTLILHDGALLVTWLDTAGNFWLRRVTPDFSLDEPFMLAAGEKGKVTGFPRAALARDYSGGKAPAQFVVAFAREGTPAALHTLLVSVPEGDLLEAEKHCDCAPSPESLQGFAIRGTMTEAVPATGALRVKHFDVPGIFAAGTHDFKVAPDTLAAVPPGRQFFARIERREGAWWLFDVRLLAEVPAK